MPVDWSVVLPAQEQKVLRAVDVARVVRVMPGAVRLLRSDVRDLRDDRRPSAVPEDRKINGSSHPGYAHVLASPDRVLIVRTV